jgi:hypothetical protein
MPSIEKRYNPHTQFHLIYSNKVSINEIVRVVTHVLLQRGASIVYFIAGEKECVFKILSPIGFSGTKKFTVDKVIPEMAIIEKGDKGLFELIEHIKTSDPIHTIHTNKYIRENKNLTRDEEGGHMFDTMQSNPNFNPSQTRFGRGHRRVTAIKSGKKIIGYRFKPFNEYTEEWASDIYGYATYGAAKRSVYPLQTGEHGKLRALYNLRPKPSDEPIDSDEDPIENEDLYEEPKETESKESESKESEEPTESESKESEEPTEFESKESEENDDSDDSISMTSEEYNAQEAYNKLTDDEKKALLIKEKDALRAAMSGRYIRSPRSLSPPKNRGSCS